MQLLKIVSLRYARYFVTQKLYVNIFLNKDANGIKMTFKKTNT